MCLQANGWVNGQRMEWMWLCCMSSVQHRLKTELFSVAIKHIYIYYDRSVCVRDKSEKTGIESVRLQGCFRLQFDWRGWVERTQTTSNQQRANHQHYILKTLFCTYLLVLIRTSASWAAGPPGGGGAVPQGHQEVPADHGGGRGRHVVLLQGPPGHAGVQPGWATHLFLQGTGQGRRAPWSC